MMAGGCFSLSAETMESHRPSTKKPMNPLRTALIIISYIFAHPLAEAAPNVLLICIDDLRPELGCYGVKSAKTPHIDHLASEGRSFTRHYVQAPTCGASRYAMLTGLYGPRGNDALTRRAADAKRKPSMPEVFRNAGYTTVAVGKVSHHPGGLFGKNWQDPDKVEMPGAWDRQPLPCGPWKHPEGLMHGLANGATRGGNKNYPALESVKGADAIYPDGLITDAALQEMDQLASAKKPFFLAVGLIRPHLPFGMPERYLDEISNTPLAPIPHPQKPAGITTWHGSGEFFRYGHGGLDPRTDESYAIKVRKHYAACVSYADAQVGELLDQLKSLSLDKETIVVIWGDHGWHLGEHGIWGKHSLFEESLRSPLIIRMPGQKHAGKPSNGVVESIDLLPTLCELSGIQVPDFLHGKSLRPQLEDPSATGKSAISYSPGAETLRTDRYRLIRHSRKNKAPVFELYDHQSPEAETRNLAEAQPGLCKSLAGELDTRLALSHPAPKP
jgi:iduronate 2-sulfatase